MSIANEIPKKEIAPLKKNYLNIYNPADIKRWGVARFLDEVCLKEPISIPDFGFSTEESKRMDAILEEEKRASVNDI